MRCKTSFLCFEGMEERRYTLDKSERLCSKKLIERLFAGGSKSFPAYPLRVVYTWVEPENSRADASMLISVPKKRFKHAVKRNHVKRQIREAYRLNKHILVDALHAQETTQKMALGFIWLDNRLYDSREVTLKVRKMLHHIAEDR